MPEVHWRSCLSHSRLIPFIRKEQHWGMVLGASGRSSTSTARRWYSTTPGSVAFACRYLCVTAAYSIRKREGPRRQETVCEPDQLCPCAAPDSALCPLGSPRNGTVPGASPTEECPDEFRARSGLFGSCLTHPGAGHLSGTPPGYPAGPVLQAQKVSPLLSLRQ